MTMGCAWLGKRVSMKPSVRASTAVPRSILRKCFYMAFRFGCLSGWLQVTPPRSESLERDRDRSVSGQHSEHHPSSADEISAASSQFNRNSNRRGTCIPCQTKDRTNATCRSNRHKCQRRTAPKKINELDMQDRKVVTLAASPAIGVPPAAGDALLQRHAPPDRHGESLR